MKRVSTLARLARYPDNPRYRLQSPGAVLLAAPRQRAHPEHHDVVPERGQGVDVGWHCVIGKEACRHLPQPLSLAGDRIVHPAPKLLLDLPHLGPFTVAAGPPKEQKPAAP